MANCKQMLMGGGKPQTPKVRDERIDSVKYWLIVLVIVGHIVNRPQFGIIPESRLIYDWIYTFHMPLFIFISGYFSRKKEYLFKSLWKIIEPLILIQSLWILIFIIKGDITLKRIFTPYEILWYLLSLIYWRLMLQMIPDKILNNKKLVITITFIISIIAGFFPFNRFLSLQRALSFMPFFFLGYCLRDKNLFLPNKYKPLCLIFLILAYKIPDVVPQYYFILSHADPYIGDYTALSRIFIFCLSIPMSLAFMNICPNIAWTAKQGKLTMQYYVYHIIILDVFAIIFKTNIPVSLLHIFVYATVITVGIGLASYLPFFKLFTNPSQYLKS